MSSDNSAVGEDLREVVVDAGGPVGVVRLNRAGRGNSVTPAVVTALGDAVRELGETDGVRAVVLTGTGSVFCAGADVQDMYAVYRDDGADGLMDYLGQTWMPAVQRTVRALWAAPKPLVAAYQRGSDCGRPGLRAHLRHAGRRDGRPVRRELRQPRHGAGGRRYVPAAPHRRAVGGDGATGLRPDHRRDEGQGARVGRRGLRPRRSDGARDRAGRAAHAWSGRDRQPRSRGVVRRPRGRSWTPRCGRASKRTSRSIARDDVRARILAVMEKFSRPRRLPLSATVTGAGH